MPKKSDLLDPELTLAEFGIELMLSKGDQNESLMFLTFFFSSVLE
jgi:hypothetical protein